MTNGQPGGFFNWTIFSSCFPLRRSYDYKLCLSTRNLRAYIDPYVIFHDLKLGPYIGPIYVMVL